MAQYKDKNTTVRFSVRNCPYECQMYLYYINNSILASDLWPLCVKAKRNCIVDKSLKIIKLYNNYKKCSMFDP
jgi:hypothetical protein